MQDLIEQVTEASRRRRADADGRYAALVDAVARGEDLDAEEVADELADLGRDARAFAQDVARLARRVAARKALDDRPAAERDRGKAEAEHAAVVAELARSVAAFEAEQARRLKELKATFAPKLDAARTAIAAAQARVNLADEGRGVLCETAAPELLDRVADLKARLAAARAAADGKLPGLKARLTHLEAILARELPPVRDEAVNTRIGSPIEVKRWRSDEEKAREGLARQQANCRREAEDVRAEIARTEAAVPALAAELAAAERSLLEV
jgi:hypothetical protein